LAIALPAAAQGKHPNYDDDVKPIFARYCFGCHNASEMRSGLSLESYAGVMKGGGSGDAVIPGRAASSLLFKAVNRDEGAPQMPLGMAKLPDATIAVIREWIAGGVLETATSQPKGNVAPSLDYKPSDLNKPTGPAAMPQSLAALTLPESARPHPITALAASPWAPLIAVAGHERIYLCDIAKRATAGELAFPEGIPYVLRFSRDGSLLLAAGGKSVQSGKAVLYDVRTGERRGVFGNEMDIILAADLSADGKLVAIGGPGKVVKVFSVPDGKPVYELAKKHTDWITAIEFSPDSQKLATADRAGGILLWEAASGGVAGALSDHKDSITALSWRGDSQLLASASEDGTIIIWNANDGFPVSTIGKSHAPGVLSVQFTVDGRIVSVGRDSTIRVWGADGKPRGAAAPSDALLTKVVSSADGKVMVAGDYQGRVVTWDGQKTSPLRGSAAPTFSHDVAAIVYRQCVSCHRDGGVAPFSLTTYQDAAKRAKLIATVTASRYMPPWLPSEPHFQNERRLTVEEIATIARWAEAGAPEGNPAATPKPPAFADGWQLGKPDIEAQMPATFNVPAEGQDLYRCFAVPIAASADRWVSAIDMRPGSPKVVHHAILFQDTTGTARKRDTGSGYECFGTPGFLPARGLGGWTPGSIPVRMADGVPELLHAGATLVLQVHYHPTGKAEMDRTRVALYFTNQKPRRRAMDLPLGSNRIDIPAGESHYKVTDYFTLPVDVDVLGINPHAHYLCKEMYGYAVLPDGTRRTLIRIPSWNFDWQQQYTYTSPIRLPEGTRVQMEFTYDNSKDNPRNPNHPPKRVVWGPGSTDEMAGLHVEVSPVKEEDAEELSQTLWGKMMRQLGGGIYRPPK